jgi:hypothetical protein
MFKPYVEHTQGFSFDPESPRMSQEVLEAAEKLTSEEFQAAEASLSDTDVRPVPARNMLSACVPPDVLAASLV